MRGGHRGGYRGGSGKTQRYQPRTTNTNVTENNTVEQTNTSDNTQQQTAQVVYKQAVNPQASVADTTTTDTIEQEEQPTAEQTQKPVPAGRVYVGNLPWTISWQDLKDHMRQAGNVERADVFLDETGRSKGCGIVEYSTAEEALNAIKTLNDSSIKDTDRLIFVREDREDRGFAQVVGRPTIIARGRGGFRGYPRGGFTRGGGGYFQAGRGRGRGRGYYNANQQAGNYNNVDNSNVAINVQNGNANAGYSVKGKQVFVGNLPYNVSWQDLKDKFRPCGNVIRADILMDISGRSKGSGTILFETRYEATRAISTFDNTEYGGRMIAVHEDKFA